MARRLSTFERRLARLAGIVGSQSAAAERERDLHNGRKAVAALIRDALQRAGLDPAEAAALRRFEAPEPPPPRPAPHRGGSHAAFFEEIRALAERMHGDPPPLATASPAALLAYYCFGDGAREEPT